MNTVRSKFDDDEEPAYFVFWLSQQLRNRPYDCLSIGLLLVFSTKWASVVKRSHEFGQLDNWSSWLNAGFQAGRPEFFLPAVLVVLASSAGLTATVTGIVRVTVGVAACLWFFAALIELWWVYSSVRKVPLGDLKVPSFWLGQFGYLALLAVHLALFRWSWFGPKPLAGRVGRRT
jgi:hypothetical protein